MNNGAAKVPYKRKSKDLSTDWSNDALKFAATIVKIAIPRRISMTKFLLDRIYLSVWVKNKTYWEFRRFNLVK